MKKASKSTENLGKGVKKPVAVKRKLDAVKKDCCTQTEKGEDDLLLITGGEPESPTYWRMLAEKRLKIIEELIVENDKLQNKVEDLESENRLLESILQDTKELAEYVTSLPEDPDESGIEQG